MTETKPRGFYETSKEHYKHLLLQTILERGPIHRRELAEVLHLRPATQKRFLVELLEEGLVRECGNVVVRRGRGAILLTVNPEGGRFIGLTLDPNCVRGALCSFDLGVLREETRPIDPNDTADEIQSALFELVDALRLSPEADGRKLWGIGYGEFGLVDMEQGVALRSVLHTHWRDIPIRQMFSDHFDVPVALESRERCSLLSERIWGAARHSDTALWIEVGGGVGLAVMYRGEVVGGATGLAGEIGHMRVVQDGELCVCGGYGCLETVSSARAIVARVAQALTQGVHSVLSSDEASGLTIERVVEAAQEGDRLTSNVLQTGLYHIGVAIGNAVNLLNPDTIILHGDLFRAGGERLVEELRREAENVMLGESKSHLAWGVSELTSPIPRGAAALIFEELFGVKPSRANIGRTSSEPCL
jgi:N-acetylglucosamine repressor